MVWCHHCPPQRAKVLNSGLWGDSWQQLKSTTVNSFVRSLDVNFLTPAEAGGHAPHQVISPLGLLGTAWSFPRFWIQIQIFLLADAEQNLCCALLLVSDHPSWAHSCLSSLESHCAPSGLAGHIQKIIPWLGEVPCLSSRLDLALQQPSTTNCVHV